MTLLLVVPGNKTSTVKFHRKKFSRKNSRFLSSLKWRPATCGKIAKLSNTTEESCKLKFLQIGTRYTRTPNSVTSVFQVRVFVKHPNFCQTPELLPNTRTYWQTPEFQKRSNSRRKFSYSHNGTPEQTTNNMGDCKAYPPEALPRWNRHWCNETERGLADATRV